MFCIFDRILNFFCFRRWMVRTSFLTGWKRKKLSYFFLMLSYYSNKFLYIGTKILLFVTLACIFILFTKQMKMSLCWVRDIPNGTLSSEVPNFDLQASSLKNMSVGLKKSPSNGCEKGLTSEEEQTKVFATCMLLHLVIKMLLLLWEEKLLKLLSFSMFAD